MLRFNDFLQTLNETPITDYNTMGDWSKAHGFKSAKDRMLINNPATIKYMHKKFENTEYDFNLLFVNSKEGNKHTEVGAVKPEWVRQNLGDDVYKKLTSLNLDDKITIIFTNNKGDERSTFTTWIAAHRIFHALARKNGLRTRSVFLDFQKEFFKHAVTLLQDVYGIKSAGMQRNELSGDTDKLIKNLFQHVCTFKSARDRNIRNAYEVINELGAQYLTTGKIKLNPLPNSFKWNRTNVFIRDKQAGEEYMEGFEHTLEYYIDALLSNALNTIFVM